MQFDSVNGPDEEGDVDVIIGYNFPNTWIADPQRLLKLTRDGVEIGQLRPSQVSSTWPKTVGTSCLSQGSHEIKVKAVACNQGGDPDYEAVAATTVQVDHRPEVAFESMVPTPQGSQQVSVYYNFPQTVFDFQREVILKVLPSGSTVATIHPTVRENTSVRTVPCSWGSWIEAIATACPAQPEARVVVRDVAALPGCPRPPRKDDPCGKSGEGEGKVCCLAGGAGPGGGGPGLGGGKSGPPGFGPGARLHYLASGAGSPGNPGQAAWNTLLGVGWSHDYAERIVPASEDRAWLITRYGSFREYTDANGDGFYETVSPEDEYRTLTQTATGWTLRDLDGTVTSFDTAGLWVRTADRHSAFPRAVG